MHFAQKHPATSVQNVENMDTRRFLRKILLTQKRWRAIFVLQAVKRFSVTFHKKRQKRSPNGRGPRPRACGQRKNKKEEFL